MQWDKVETENYFSSLNWLYCMMLHVSIYSLCPENDAVIWKTTETVLVRAEIADKYQILNPVGCWKYLKPHFENRSLVHIKNLNRVSTHYTFIGGPAKFPSWTPWEIPRIMLRELQMWLIKGEHLLSCCHISSIKIVSLLPMDTFAKGSISRNGVKYKLLSY